MAQIVEVEGKREWRSTYRNQVRLDSGELERLKDDGQSDYIEHSDISHFIMYGFPC